MTRMTFDAAIIAMRPWHCSEVRMREMVCSTCEPYYVALDAVRSEREEHLARIAVLEAKVAGVGRLLEENGCDCDCGCDSDGHDLDCDLCFPCRVDAALAGDL